MEINFAERDIIFFTRLVDDFDRKEILIKVKIQFLPVQIKLIFETSKSS